MITKHFAQIVFVLSVFIAGVFTSCDKNEEMLQAPQVMNQLNEVKDPQTTELRSAAYSSDYAVDDDYKDGYYNGHRYASNYFDSNFIEEHPVGVGFFAAYNAVHGTDYLAKHETLATLCDDHGCEFRSFTDAKRLKWEVEDWLETHGKPVVISILTNQKDRKGNYRVGTVIVWASRKGVAKVTNTNFFPTPKFGDNWIINQTYEELLSKAQAMSSRNLANVAFIN